MKIAFLRTGQEEGIGRHILALLRAFRERGYETLELDLREGDLREKVEKLSQFGPHFVMDINSTGFIVAQQENGEKVPLCDAMGFAHVSIFVDDPLFYFSPVIDASKANNFLPIVCDLKYADTLKFLGNDKGYFYITPFIDKVQMIQPTEQKEIDVSFLGPVIDPDIVARSVLQNIREDFAPLFFEVGDFLFRNPEAHLLYAFEYIFSMFNSTLQEEFLKWRQENPEEFLRFLNDISAYATAKKRWYIINFLDGLEIKVIGKVEGELPEGHQEVTINSTQDLLAIYDKSRLSIMVYPQNVPTGVGFSPLEACYMESAAMVDYRATLPGFLLPGQEVITFLPVDRADIEEKVLYYLDNAKELEEIAKNGQQKVIQRYSYEDRAEFITNLFEDIFRQSVDASRNRDVN